MTSHTTKLLPDGGTTTAETATAAGGYLPKTCIGFDVTAGFAHFKKVGNNSAKPTYKIPPRTTLAGMLAGIMGMPRDSYYDLFSPNSSAVAVVPKKMPHTHTMGITTVNTAFDETIQYLPKEKKWTEGKQMLTPESYVNADRQRDTYEMLIDPVYRVYVGLKDEDIHTDLLDRLENTRYHYSPSLGLSECLADIRNVDTHTVDPSADGHADSATYDDSVVIPQPGVTISRERAPLYMEAHGNGRRTTEYGNITYAADGDKLPVDNSALCTVGEHAVVFA